MVYSLQKTRQDQMALNKTDLQDSDHIDFILPKKTRNVFKGNEDMTIAKNLEKNGKNNLTRKL